MFHFVFYWLFCLSGMFYQPFGNQLTENQDCSDYSNKVIIYDIIRGRHLCYIHVRHNSVTFIHWKIHLHDWASGKFLKVVHWKQTGSCVKLQHVHNWIKCLIYTCFKLHCQWTLYNSCSKINSHTNWGVNAKRGRFLRK